MKTVKFDKSLLYYDGDVLFIGRNDESAFVFSLVDPKKGTYIGTQISDKDIEQIEAGLKDVSTIFTRPKSRLFYPCTFEKGHVMKLRYLSTKDIIKEFLCPAKGLFLDPQFKEVKLERED